MIQLEFAQYLKEVQNDQREELQMFRKMDFESQFRSLLKHAMKGDTFAMYSLARLLSSYNPKLAMFWLEHANYLAKVKAKL
jgi:hypothetical protein